jgi:hypothetical protein
MTKSIRQGSESFNTAQNAASEYTGGKVATLVCFQAALHVCKQLVLTFAAF